MTRRSGQLLGIILLVLAAVLAVGLIVTSGRDGVSTGTAGDDLEDVPADDTLAAAGDAQPADPPPITEPIPVGDGTFLEPVAEVAGATALSVVDGEVRATDATTGTRYTVRVASGTVTGPTTFGSLSRVDRSVPDPAGDGRWVAESQELHHLGVDGEVTRTIALEVPGAIASVDEAAVWLTVSGLPGAHSGAAGGSVVQSYVQRVDRASGEVVALAVDEPEGFRFALGAGGAWVSADRTVFRLDPVTVEVVDEVPFAGPVTALVPHGDDLLVVVDASDSQVVRLGPDLAVVETHLVGPGAVTDAALVPATDPAGADELWVLRPELGVVTRLGLASGTTSDVVLPAPRRIAVDGRGQPWILSQAGGGVLLRRTDRPSS